MEANSNKNSETYGYHTNQMCKRCDKYKSGCTGRMREMFMKSINHFCPEFKDRNYTNEQSRQKWHLDDFVKNFNKM